MLANPENGIPKVFNLLVNATNSPRLLAYPSGIPSLSTEQLSYTSALEGFREKLSHRRTSEETVKLITRSKKTSALGKFKSAWKNCSDG